MKKYPKIKRIGDSENNGLLEQNTIFVQEKMDGANFRFTLERNIDEQYHIEGRNLVFGSRNVEYKNERDIDSAFDHAIEYVRENVNTSRLIMLDDEYGPLTFFGEAMHPHTLDYEWEDVPSFLGFDVWSDNLNEFVPSGEMRSFFSDISLQAAPKIYYGSPDNFDVSEVPDSVYRDGTAEGFIIRSYDSQQRAKVRSEKFKEMHSGMNSSSDKEGYEAAASEILANKFATEARILKIIHKYRDRGRDIQMGIMEDLWRDVFDDIIEEEYEEIFLGNHVLDTKDFRSEVASNTASVLQQYLSRPENSALNELPA